MWYSQYNVWIPTDQWRYLYDGNRVVQERINDNPVTAYTRGSDLSGSLEGAGGIGGLLSRSDTYSGGNWTSHAFYHADGNGNVTSLVNSNLAVVASYKYDPYGRTISSSGSLAAANLYRFSSKEVHPDTGMYYYLYRFYDPNVQRWLNRDPVAEIGFQKSGRFAASQVDHSPNLYRSFGNIPIGRVDPDGLKIWVCTVPTSGFPLYGAGRHAYFWDDRPGTPDKNRECGREGAYGYGGYRSGNKGPASGATGNPWRGPGGVTCYPAEGSDGKEDAIISCCQQRANKGSFVPGIQDCHTPIDDCLKANNVDSPPHGRTKHIGDIEDAMLD